MLTTLIAYRLLQKSGHVSCVGKPQLRSTTNIFQLGYELESGVSELVLYWSIFTLDFATIIGITCTVRHPCHQCDFVVNDSRSAGSCTRCKGSDHFAGLPGGLGLFRRQFPRQEGPGRVDCAKKLLPWLDRMLEADKVYFK